MVKTCPHVGVLHPEKFSCISCYDNAEDCNCFVCMGVFCEECNEIIDIECEDVRNAYMENKH